MKKGLGSLFLALAAAGASAGSAAQPTVEAPRMLVGDKWEFAATAEDGKPSKWSREIVEIPSAEHLRVRTGAKSIADYDAAMNFMPEGNPDFARVLVKYPLDVGSEWRIARRFPNPSTGEDGKAKVVAYETLTVPAGTYQCYRVEANSALTNRTYTERRTWVRWYCPEVKWIAKETAETITFNPYNPAATGTTKLSSELVRFAPGK